jgi:hypothetical protein
LGVQSLPVLRDFLQPEKSLPETPFWKGPSPVIQIGEEQKDLSAFRKSIKKHLHGKYSFKKTYH